MPLHLGNTDDVSLRHRCTADESLNGADTTSLCSFCGKNLRSIRRNGSLGRHRAGYNSSVTETMNGRLRVFFLQVLVAKIEFQREVFSF